MRLRLASREPQLLGAEEGSVRSQAHTPFSHIHPIPDLGQPPHVSPDSSPASLPPASPLTLIHQSCHCLPDGSPSCCQMNGPKACFITATFIYRRSLKLLGLAFTVVQNGTLLNFFNFVSPFFQMRTLHVCQTVCALPTATPWLR